MLRSEVACDEQKLVCMWSVGWKQVLAALMRFESLRRRAERPRWSSGQRHRVAGKGPLTIVK